MRKALIIGGGVAGPVAAMSLQRAGLEAIVYEAHPQTTEETRA
jgi:2-polyprenyl-6-methoxyphenol hydroxylase-like FAD-dependent oxidoreductase